MTPAVRQLKKQRVVFTLHQYQHDASANSFGEEAVEKLNINAEQVFKTLIVSCDGDENSLAVAIVPVTHQLNLKMLAKALNVKKTKMADAKQVEKSTGYVLGGVSPIGQKKTLKAVVDNSAKNFNTIFVSGGKRGLEIELAPIDLAKTNRAQFAEIKK